MNCGADLRTPKERREIEIALRQAQGTGGRRPSALAPIRRPPALGWRRSRIASGSSSVSAITRAAGRGIARANSPHINRGRAPMANRKNPISEQWAARSIEMLESPAYRVLSLSAHRALSRIEVEFAHHAGNDNGKLPVTFDDFAEYGVRRHSIEPATRRTGSARLHRDHRTRQMARAAEYRRSNLFLLMSRPKQKGIEVANRWRQFKTIEEARSALAAALPSASKKKKLPVTKRHCSRVPKRHCKSTIASAETAPLCISAETAPLSISRVGNAPPGLAPPPADDAPRPLPQSTPS